MYKKIAITLLAAVGLVTSTYGQGTVNFNNNAVGLTNAEVYDAPGFGGNLLGAPSYGVGNVGTNWYAQLYALPGTGANQDELLPIGKPVYFRSGANAGYVQQSGTNYMWPGFTTIKNVVTNLALTAGGPMTVQLRAWWGGNTVITNYYQALTNANVNARHGRSATINLASTGNPVDPSGPTTPVDLVGLTGFALQTNLPAGLLTTVTVSPPSQTNNAGSKATFTATAVGFPVTYQWRRNGADLPSRTSSSLEVLDVRNANEGSYTVEVTHGVVGNRVTNAPAATLTVSDPFITSNPVNRTNNAGTDASFSVVDTGTGVRTYQWRRDNIPLYALGRIVGTNTSTLWITNVSQADATNGNYTVVVTGADGQVASSAATLTVIDPPVIVGGPASRTNWAGTAATFTVTVNGTPPYSYQWKKNGFDLNDVDNISGATTATLTVSAVVNNDQGSYKVIVSNPASSGVESTNAFLTVIDPNILTQPADSIAAIGGDATFTVVAAGTGLGYQWRSNTVVLDGETANTLVVRNVSMAEDLSSYSVTIYGVYGNTNSTTARVRISATVVDNPDPVTTSQGSTATFSVIAGGSGSLSYQWYKGPTPLINGIYVAGATSATLTLSGVTALDNGDYSVVVANPPYGLDTSEPATLTVTAPTESFIPTITLLSPAGGDYATSQVEARGAATDKVGGKVARVLVRVISGTTTGAWQSATLGAYKTNVPAVGQVTANWTNVVTLATGTNIVEAMAQDTSLNNSLSKTAKAFFKVPGVLTLVTNGPVEGQMSVLLANLPASPPYYVGRTYTLKVKPSLNNLFSNVVANGTIIHSARPDIAAQKGTNVNFMMETNLTLVGNFMTNRFLINAGTYHGLFTDAAGVAHQSAGYIKFVVSKTLTFTCSMLLRGETVSSSGSFDLAGVGKLTKLAARAGMTNEPINVLPIMDFAAKQLKGTVVSLSNSWTADIDTDLAVYNLTTVPPAGTLGRYTMRLPSSGLAGEPGGDGYATVNVKRSATSGAVQLAVDNDPVLLVSANYFGDQERMVPVAAVPPSKDGRYPFYAKLYKFWRPAINPPTPPTTGMQTTYYGSVLGWLTIGTSNLTGDLVWNKIGWTNGAYDAGFSNEVTVVGSSYVPPTLFGQIALGSNAVCVLEGGGLVTPITNLFHWVSTGTGTSQLIWPTAGSTNNPNSIKLTINSGTGRIEGTFVLNTNLPTIKANVKSAVLQNTKTAHGNFKVKGGPVSGSMLMYQPVP